MPLRLVHRKGLLTHQIIIEALPPHRATPAARTAVIRAALEASPEKAIPRLRELYADDPGIADCIAALEKIGQPSDYRVTTLDGLEISATENRGKIVLLHFWSSQTTAPL